MAQSHYFKRLIKETKRISPHIRFKRIKMGFYRVFYRDRYLHEMDERMPYLGYNFEVDNPRLANKEYYEEYEENIEMIRKVKNYAEGYVDAKDRIQTRMYMMRHSGEFNEHSRGVYNNAVIR